MTWNWTATVLPADPRRDLRVFTLTPNWQPGVLERLSWLTEVMTSEAGVEQRRSVRRYPRRSFEAQFLRAASGRSRLDLFVTGVGVAVFMVPLWHEQIKLAENPGDNSAVFPLGELETREFRVNDLVLVNAGDPNDYDVLTVQTIDLPSGTMTLASPADTRVWPVGTRLTPLRRAKITDTTSMSALTDRVGQMGIRFELQDADTSFVPSWNYCTPLWRTKPDRKVPITLQFSRNAYVLDLQSGVLETFDVGERAKVSESVSIKLYGRRQATEFRQALYATRGRATRFYMPTFTTDLIASDDFVGMTMDVEPTGMSDYLLVEQEARKILGVYFNDGRPTIYRTIADVSPVLVGTPTRHVADRITFTQAMPPILKREVERLGFVMPSRLDQDTIEIAHRTDQLAALSSSLVMTSSIVEGMPPIDCWVTSWTYPLNPVEQMSSQVLVGNGVFYDPRFEENMIVAIVPPSTAVLKNVLLAYDNKFDNMTVAITPPGDGTIVVFGFKSYTDVPENMRVAVTPPSAGALGVKLITYDRYPVESLIVGILVEQGTLA